MMRFVIGYNKLVSSSLWFVRKSIALLEHFRAYVNSSVTFLCFMISGLDHNRSSSLISSKSRHTNTSHPPDTGRYRNSPRHPDAIYRYRRYGIRNLHPLSYGLHYRPVLPPQQPLERVKAGEDSRSGRSAYRLAGIGFSKRIPRWPICQYSSLHIFIAVASYHIPPLSICHNHNTLLC